MLAGQQYATKGTLVDTAELIASALAEGAAACRRRTIRTGVPGALSHLWALVAARLPAAQRDRVTLAERDPGDVALLAEALRLSGADTDQAVIAAARRLIDLLHPRGQGGAADGGRSRESGRPGPGRIAEVPEPSGQRDFLYRGWVAGSPARDAAPAAGTPRATYGHRTGRTGMGTGAAGVGRRPVPDRVIVIDGCAGIQAGTGNYQVSVYRVTLPPAALKSPRDLAERLLDPRTPWAGDLFSHDARLRPPAPPSRDPDYSGIVQGPRGDTLVIVRHSRGVQVGDGNVQHNKFQIRVPDVSVHMDDLAMTAKRQQAVSRLRADPGDKAAARSLAEDVAAAAAGSLHADLTARVEREFGDPYIWGWSGKLSDRTGVQVGELGQARVEIDMPVPKFDVDALAREFGSAARRTTPTRPRRPPDPGREGPGAGRAGR